MRITLLFWIYLSLGIANSYGQSNKPHLSDSTSNILNLISYFWIKDSLANNGFRLYSYERVLKSKVDKVTPDILIEKLGNPNKIQNTNHGVQYWYFVFDTKAMPKEFGKPFECIAIIFRFRGDNRTLYEIGETVLDY